MSTAALSQGIALSGMAHDGIDSVPETGTWLLQKGERVMTAETSAKLDQRLDGSMGANVTVNNNAPGAVATVRQVDSKMIIDVVAADAAKGGRAIRASQRALGLRRRGR